MADVAPEIQERHPMVHHRVPHRPSVRQRVPRQPEREVVRPQRPAHLEQHRAGVRDRRTLRALGEYGFQAITLAGTCSLLPVSDVMSRWG